MSLLGCAKYDQSFKTTPVNELTIDAGATIFTAVQFDTFKIPVSIRATQPDKAKYRYIWKAIADDSVYVLSHEQNLDIKMELPPKRYNLQFTAIDEDNGLEHSKLFTLVVTGVFSEGWLVSHNIGTNGRLTFVRMDNKMFENPAEEVNNMKFPGKAMAAFSAEIPSYSEYASIHYFTESGVYRFDPVGFLLTGTTNNVFTNQTVFSNPAYGANLTRTDQYYVNNGDVHAGMGSFTPDQISMPFSEGFGGDYYLFPVVINSAQLGTFFYDNKYKRFLNLPYLDRQLVPAVGSSKDLFNMADVGKTMIAADKGRGSSSTAVFYFIMEDNSGRYIYGLNADKPSLFQKIDPTKCPEINQATAFATSGVLQQMYYAVDNKIYLYNIVANSAELLYSFPNATKIRDIKMKRSTSKTLAVATWANSAGQFHTFDINDLGTFVGNSPSKTLNGFGEIVHISIK